MSSPTATVAPRSGSNAKSDPKPEPKILFQKFFKSVGPRTYAAQLKEAGTGNHFLVLTEGKRDEKTHEVRKSRLFVFSEDFVEFFAMISEATRFANSHPVPEEVKRRQQQYWNKKHARATTKA